MTPTQVGPRERTESGEEVTRLLDRVRSEFLEMPGLLLTVPQAARLWALDRPTSELILDGLAAMGFLMRNTAGAYSRFHAP